MKKHFSTFAFAAALVCLTSINHAFGQTPTGSATAPQPVANADAGITPNRALGDVTAISQEAKTLSLKTSAGNSVLVAVADSTVIMRTQPGATNLDGATKITLAEIGIGDRLLAMGRVSEDRKNIPARQLIVMTKADIAKKHERDRTQWKQRGIVGTVTAVNPATKEVTVSVRSREGVKPLVIAAGGEKILYRRYAPDSIKFEDAKPSGFAELKTGDQVRALGERSADGAAFTPEEIVSGSFRQLVGTVTAVDAATNQIKITTQDKKLLTVLVNSDSNLRRLPPMMAQMMAQRAAGGGQQGGGAAGGQGGRPPAGEGGGMARPPRADGAERGGGGGGGGRRMMGGGGGAGGGGFDAQDLLERMPQLNLAELKPGEMIVVSSTVGADPTRLTAMALVAGIDAIINAMPARSAGPNVAGGQNLGMPGGIDLGIGLP